MKLYSVSMSHGTPMPTYMFTELLQEQRNKRLSLISDQKYFHVILVYKTTHCWRTQLITHQYKNTMCSPWTSFLVNTFIFNSWVKLPRESTPTGKLPDKVIFEEVLPLKVLPTTDFVRLHIHQDAIKKLSCTN